MNDLSIVPRQRFVSSILISLAIFTVLMFLSHERIVTLPEIVVQWWPGTLVALNTLVALSFAVLGPLFIRLFRRILYVYRVPGTAPLARDVDFDDVVRGFAAERTEIKLAMAPEHDAAAKPARSARSVDVGDARLTLSSRDINRLSRFFGRAKHVETHRDVLIVTGEPGAGKSVLLQEIHASLSLGVEEGYHTFIPLFVFARDIHLADLEMVKHSQTPMQDFLHQYYFRRIETSGQAAGLRALANLVRTEWKRLDCVVIIDGLDEIAQRSAYETIQRELYSFITADIEQNRGHTHRYVTSCRIDEDLRVYPSAESVYLAQLSDTRREEFCKAMIERSDIRSDKKEVVRELLESSRVAPSHVFRRNPYFLSLLLRHYAPLAGAANEVVNEASLTFSQLMDSYLERESQRPHRLARAAKANVTKLDLRKVFVDFQALSSLSLQYYAFRSCSAQALTALYDVIKLDRASVLDFTEAFTSMDPASLPSDEEQQSDWTRMARFILGLLNPRIDNEQLVNRSSFPSENERRILAGMIDDCRKNGSISAEYLYRGLGNIPYFEYIEDEQWYRDFCQTLARTLEGSWSPAQKILILVLVRSLAAAQILRIIYIDNKEGKESASVTFRHRRLAEYFAAQYVASRWIEVRSKMSNSPWLTPIRELAAAIEGKRCWVLEWGLQRLHDTPKSPLHIWRFAFEEAADLCAFSHPGPAFDKMLSYLVGYAIALTADHDVGQNPTTRLVVLRSINRLLALEEDAEINISSEIVHAYYGCYAVTTNEWILEVARVGRAIESVSKTPPTRSVRRGLLKRVIAHPQGFLGGRREPRVRSLFRIAVGSVILGELVMLGLVLLGLWSIGEIAEVPSRSYMFASVPVLLTIIVMRALSWFNSPTQAARWGSWLWRRVLRNTAVDEPKPSLRTTLMNAAGAWALAIATVTLTWAAWFDGVSENIGKTTPCRDMTQAGQAQAEKIFERIQESDILGAQRQIRAARDEIRGMQNGRACGFGKGDDRTLAEDRLVDGLFEINHRYVPTPNNNDEFALTDEDAGALAEALDFREIGLPEEGVLGSIEAISLAWAAESEYVMTRDLYHRVREARREGYAVPRTQVWNFLARGEFADQWSGEEMELTAAVETHLTKATKLKKSEVEALHHRARGSLFFAGLGFLTGAGLLVAGWRIARLRQSRDLIESIEASVDVDYLCTLIVDEGYAEIARVASVVRLAEIPAKSDEQVENLNRVIATLSRTSDELSRRLAVAVAGVSNGWANALRHRITERTPDVQPQREAADEQK